MRKLFNELEYAEEILATPNIKKSKRFESLKIIVKYFKSLEYSDSEIKDEIKKFGFTHIEGFNEVRYLNMINNLIKFSRKSKLVVIKNIQIKKSEMDKIISIPNEQIQRLAFILLVFGKRANILYGTNYISRKQIKDTCLAKYAHLKISKDKRNELYRYLIKNDFISVTLQSDIQVKFIDTEDSEVVFEITDFSDVIRYYLEYTDNIVRVCKDCGKVIQVNPNIVCRSKQKYCDECQQRRKLESYNKYNKKRNKP